MAVLPGEASYRSEAFRQGLRALGWVEGQNLVIECRSTQGTGRPLPDLAAELVRLEVDCDREPGGATIPAAKHATQTIPIVMAERERSGAERLVASLARPGGNITDVANLTHELDGKRLELLKEAVPQITRVAVLWDRIPPAQPRGGDDRRQ